MPIVQIRELPPFRFVCRRVADTDDLDLLLAETGALMLWADENGCAPSRSAAWYVLDSAGAIGSVEVAIPIGGDAPPADGLTVRRTESTTFAVATCPAYPSAARACAARLRESPEIEPDRPLPRSATWVRLDPAPTQGLAGATVHVPLASGTPPEPE